MLEDTLQKIASGADFADMARLYSEDPSTKDSGGLWNSDGGWVKRGIAAPEIERAIFSLQKGKVSDVLTLSPSGVTAFYIFLAEDRKAGVTKPLKEMREAIKRHLLQVERQKMQQAWIDRLRKKAHIKIN